MKRGWAWVLGMGGAVLVLAGAVGVQVLRGADPLVLQACAQGERAPVAWVCEQGLYRLHLTAADVQRFNATAGALFAVNGPSEPQARRLLKHYLDAGVNVNAPDLRVPARWTALHVAASQPNVLAVRLLLEQGADPRAVDAQGRTPAELAREQLQRHPDQEREAVLRLLDQYAQRPPVGSAAR